ncbi:hypothetical protein SAMN00790413_00564 [Deinococcus hopiensis KR-140]|uniref:Uncharacterized protein n=1 Tax=Deinococcus hopiensis KR-140 TaxID=695939 RepID=A0A1W1V956_9DEIO|nr:hypothetical protein SAMN00790413_00564 [Deinococcus hopiensis KR-140]
MWYAAITGTVRSASSSDRARFSVPVGQGPFPAARLGGEHHTQADEQEHGDREGPAQPTRRPASQVAVSAPAAGQQAEAQKNLAPTAAA